MHCIRALAQRIPIFIITNTDDNNVFSKKYNQKVFKISTCHDINRQIRKFIFCTNLGFPENSVKFCLNCLILAQLSPNPVALKIRAVQLINLVLFPNSYILISLLLITTELHPVYFLRIFFLRKLIETVIWQTILTRYFDKLEVSNSQIRLMKKYLHLQYS